MEYRSLEREMFGFVFVRSRREGDILNRAKWVWRWKQEVGSSKKNNPAYWNWIIEDGRHFSSYDLTKTLNLAE